MTVLVGHFEVSDQTKNLGHKSAMLATLEKAQGHSSLTRVQLSSDVYK